MMPNRQRNKAWNVYPNERQIVNLSDDVFMDTSDSDCKQITVNLVYNETEGRPRRSNKAWDTLQPSVRSLNAINPVREIVDVLSIKPNPEKTLIKLHLGDPTLSDTMKTHPSVLQALQESLMSGKYNGYGPATGIPHVREALAAHVTSPKAPVTSEDIILTSGCSHALQLAIEVLACRGDNILVPSPGFPLYTTLSKPNGIEDRKYSLIMERDWEVDLKELESLIDDRTRAIVVNNPSNPCGAVYSREHLQDILKVAERNKVPIIADEIYGDLTYNEAIFYPMTTLQPKVPILTCDGIGKRYLVPGWRLGWLIVHDEHDVFSEVRNGIRQLAQKIVGPCALVQGALPSILKNTPTSFFDHIRSMLQQNAETAFMVLSNVPGITPVESYGAMYMMVGLNMDNFPTFDDELAFVKSLISEESVYCLPGTAFHFKNAIRLVLTHPEPVIYEACERIKQYCIRHYKISNPNLPKGTIIRKWSMAAQNGFCMEMLGEELTRGV